MKTEEADGKKETDNAQEEYKEVEVEKYDGPGETGLMNGARNWGRLDSKRMG